MYVASDRGRFVRVEMETMNKEYLKLPTALFDPWKPAWAAFRNCSSDAAIMLVTLCAQPECRATLSGIFMPNMLRLVQLCAVEDPLGRAQPEEQQVRGMLDELVRCDLVAAAGPLLWVVHASEWEGVSGSALAAAVDEVRALVSSGDADARTLGHAWIAKYAATAELRRGGRPAKPEDEPPVEPGVMPGGEPPGKPGVFEHDNNAQSKKASSSLRSEEAPGLAPVTPERERGTRRSSAQGAIVTDAELRLGEALFAAGGFTSPPRGKGPALAKALSEARRLLDFSDADALAAFAWAVEHRRYWGKFRMRGSTWCRSEQWVELLRDWREQAGPAIPAQHVSAAPVYADDTTEDLLADRISGGRNLEIIDREDVA